MYFEGLWRNRMLGLETVMEENYSVMLVTSISPCREPACRSTPRRCCALLMLLPGHRSPCVRDNILDRVNTLAVGLQHGMELSRGKLRRKFNIAAGIGRCADNASARAMWCSAHLLSAKTFVDYSILATCPMQLYHSRLTPTMHAPSRVFVNRHVATG